MKLQELKKVETIEDFRETLLKLFVSNPEKREIYLKPTLLSEFYSEMNKRPFYYSVDKINSLTDFYRLDCMGMVKIKDKKFQTTDNVWDLNEEEIMNLEIVEDNNEFISKVKNSSWFMIGNGKPNMILQNICSGDFIRNNK
ncbi:hypothetical protein [Flavobacterium sp.]|uniref:hypothetical protein n=1 Tax=Flavobacterium sp. TaxID=239 RepID=UPI0026019E52|nr:hypothetical protein [Flavobacterium sp.]